MPSSHRRSPSRGSFAAILIAGLGLTLSLTQCRMVQDNIAGVRLTPGSLSKRNSCRKDCDQKFQAAQKAEEQRHKAAERACGSKDHACKKKEDALHHANQQELERDRRACKDGCYNEGNGHAGT